MGGGPFDRAGLDVLLTDLGGGVVKGLSGESRFRERPETGGRDQRTGRGVHARAGTDRTVEGSTAFGII